MNDRSIVRDNVYYFRPDYVLSTSDFACNTITDIMANILHENSKTCRPIRCSVFRLHKTFPPLLSLPNSLPIPMIIRLRFECWEKSKSIVGLSSILSTRIVIQGVIKFQTCLENSLSFFLFLFDKCLLQIEIDRRNAWKDAINYQQYSTFRRSSMRGNTF